MKEETKVDEFATVRHLEGKLVKIVGENHPCFGCVGHITGWDRTCTGKPFCEVTLDGPYSHTVAVFNGKDLKYI